MDWGTREYLRAMLVWFCIVSTASGFNITTYFWKHPEFTTFNSLMTATNVAGEINNRSSLTILGLSNSQLEPFISSFGGNLPTQEVSDVLRYHVLLEYLDWERLQQMTAEGTLVTTLYQTTGRAPNNTGAVNITSVNGQVRIGMPILGAGYNATIPGLVDKFPYDISIARISNIILPYGFDLSGSPAPNPAAINVTDVLVKAGNFNFFVSLMEASGVVSEFQSEEVGAGITIFAPTDDAFSALNPEKLQGLTADKKALILKYHVLLSYYPLGTLQTIVNPVQPTLATQAMGASSYTLNITRMRDVVAVNTGIVQAPVTETVFDEKPLAVFAVPKVLLPREIFGAKSVSVPAPAPAPVASPAPSPVTGAGLSPFQSPVFAPSPVTGAGLSPFQSPVFAPSPLPPAVPVVVPAPPVASPPVVALPPSHSPMGLITAPSSAPSSSSSQSPVIKAPTPSVFAMSPSVSPPLLPPLPPLPATTPVEGMPSSSPSPAPFSAILGKITSAAPADSAVSRAVLGFAWVLALNLLLENV